MEFELSPSILLQPGTFTILIAPEEQFVRFINQHFPHLQRHLTLYISGNFSRILGRIDRGCTDFDVQRAFTGFQLISILREAHHSLIWLEHDPGLCDDEGAPVRLIAATLAEAAGTSTVILYAPAYDAALREMAGVADRIFCLLASDEDCFSRSSARGAKSRQATLEAV